MAADGAAAPKATHPRLTLLTSILASSLAFVDGSVVNVGLPSIASNLHAGAADLQWVVNAYLLPLSALLLLGGALGDRWGRGRTLAAGVTLFGAASLACALAPSLPWLLAGRAAQGVGAAVLMPNSLALLGATFTGEARGRAIGLWAATGAAMGALGPVLGGALIDTVGWRAVFLINLPLAAGAVALALLFTRDATREARPPLDVAGALLATSALGALTWALTVGSGRAGWTSQAWTFLAVGAGLGAAFAVVERRRGDRAMAPPGMFASPSFVGLTVLTLLLYGAMGGLFVALPYLLQRLQGWSAVQAGAGLLPLPLVLAALSPVMGGVAGRVGPRLPLSVGPLIVAAGMLLAARTAPGASYWTTLLPAVLVIAVGMAGAVAPLTTAVLGSVDERHTGSASGLNSAVARTGGLVATALLGGVLSAQGAALATQFRLACVVGAAAALAAGACAFALVRNPPRTTPAQG